MVRSAPQGPRDRAQRAARTVEQGGEMQLEVHVTGEREGDDTRGLARVPVGASAPGGFSGTVAVLSPTPSQADKQTGATTRHTPETNFRRAVALVMAVPFAAARPQ